MLRGLLAARAPGPVLLAATLVDAARLALRESTGRTAGGRVASLGLVATGRSLAGRVPTAPIPAGVAALGPTAGRPVAASLPSPWLLSAAVPARRLLVRTPLLVLTGPPTAELLAARGLTALAPSGVRALPGGLPTASAGVPRPLTATGPLAPVGLTPRGSAVSELSIPALGSLPTFLWALTAVPRSSLARPALLGALGAATLWGPTACLVLTSLVPRRVTATLVTLPSPTTSALPAPVAALGTGLALGSPSAIARPSPLGPGLTALMRGPPCRLVPAPARRLAATRLRATTLLAL